jgi:hypothetical protein
MSLLRTSVQRTLVRSFHASAVRHGGGGTPPLAPFARSPVRFEPVRNVELGPNVAAVANMIISARR